MIRLVSLAKDEAQEEAQQQALSNAQLEPFVSKVLDARITADYGAFVVCLADKRKKNALILASIDRLSEINSNVLNAEIVETIQNCPIILASGEDEWTFFRRDLQGRRNIIGRVGREGLTCPQTWMDMAVFMQTLKAEGSQPKRIRKPAAQTYASLRQNRALLTKTITIRGLRSPYTRLVDSFSPT